MAKGNRGGRRGATAPTNPGTNQPTLEQELGGIGTPKTPEEALSTVNPNYYRDSKWRKNCQRCAWAYELQRRGFDVEALPSESTATYKDKFGDSQKNFDGTWRTPGNYSQVAKGDLQWSDYIGDMWGSYFGGSPASAEAIKAEILKHGNNARGFMRMAAPGGAHVVNWETDAKGKVSFYDAQPGKKNTITDFKKAGFKTFSVARTDNVELTDLIKKAVKKRGT